MGIIPDGPEQRELQPEVISEDGALSTIPPGVNLAKWLIIVRAPSMTFPWAVMY